MKPTFNAFNGKQENKDKYVNRMKMHMAADELVQGTGFQNGKGCAVGCSLDNYSHIGFEIDEIQVPFTIAILLDEIFESLSVENSRSFPLEFWESVNLGADLSLVYNQMEIWLLTDEKFGLITKMKTDDEKQVCIDLAALHQKVVSGIQTTESEWSKLAYMAYMAYMADRAYRAYRADRADMADRADRAYMAYMAYRADRAYRADMADMADMADAMRAKFIELIKAAK